MGSFVLVSFIINLLHSNQVFTYQNILAVNLPVKKMLIESTYLINSVDSDVKCVINVKYKWKETYNAALWYAQVKYYRWHECQNVLGRMTLN